MPPPAIPPPLLRVAIPPCTPLRRAQYDHPLQSSPASPQPLPLLTPLTIHPLTDDAYRNALECNKKWAQKVAQDEPDFLPTCAKGQAPPILWLGCADSRVPETTVLGCKPGDVFTHRNIANIINPTDLSLLSIVEFAVFHLKVKHIVVCGHTSCGGIAASLANSKLDILDIWLQPLRALREKHIDDLEGMDEGERSTWLAKKNVEAGVENLKRIPTVIDAMRDRAVEIHGLIYDLSTGVCDEVDCPEEETVCTKRVAAFKRV